MQTNTQLKLAEAKYLFSLMSDKLPDNKEFDYLLNAFVGSARSVTWVMRNEFARIDGWAQWFQAFAIDQEERLLLALFNSLRVQSTKRAPLRTNFILSVLIPPGELDGTKRAQLESLIGKHIVVEMSDAPFDSVEGAISVGPAHVEGVTRALRNADSDDDILNACEKYLGFLQHLVDQCVNQFAARVAS